MKSLVCYVVLVFLRYFSLSALLYLGTGYDQKSWAKYVLGKILRASANSSPPSSAPYRALIWVRISAPAPASRAVSAACTEVE